MFAFLRAINVGGHTVTMDRLRDVFLSIGCAEVETFIASGNVIFTTRASKRDALERRIEKALGAALGWNVETFIRTADELAAISRYEPFGPLDRHPAGTVVHIAFMRGEAPAAAHELILPYRSDIDDFHIHGSEFYWLIRGRMSDSAFSAARLERILDGPVTARNTNTVRRMTERYCAPR